MVAGNIREKIFLPKEKIILTKTAQEMFEAVRENIGGINVFIGCAAVADFRVKNFSDQKIKKNSSQNLTLELEKNPDILEFVGTSENRPDLVIGFAAESEEIEKHAHEKLQKKNCDLIVANDIESGKIFGSNETKVLFVEKDGVENLGKISKEKLAKLLAKKILRSRAKLASKQQ
jgi:phosphopantothenoylcysteine synthetase/decarboxylase